MDLDVVSHRTVCTLILKKYGVHEKAELSDIICQTLTGRVRGAPAKLFK